MMGKIYRGPKNINGTIGRMVKMFHIMGDKASVVVDHLRDNLERDTLDMRLRVHFLAFYIES